jgi:hypothetical protein
MYSCNRGILARSLYLSVFPAFLWFPVRLPIVPCSGGNGLLWCVAGLRLHMALALH